MRFNLAAILSCLALTFSPLALAECPSGGCPKGQVCAGNPIASFCVDKKKAVKAKDSESPYAGKKKPKEIVVVGSKKAPAQKTAQPARVKIKANTAKAEKLREN